MIKYLLFSAALVVIYLALFGNPFPGYSGADYRAFGDQCRDWISREYSDGKGAKVGDHWTKKGSVVFEVLVPTTAATSQVFLCVFDPANGRMIKPSAFDQSWNR